VKEMKIGYFVGKFPYSTPVPNYKYGGGEIAAYNLAINMAKRGHAVHVFTTSADSRDSIEEEGNLTIHRYSTIAQFFERNFTLNLIYKPFTHEVDIVHVHIGSSPLELIAALIYARMKKKPLVATYHGDVIPSLEGFIYKSGVHIYNEVVKKVLSHANVIISPSKYYITESIFLKKYSNKIVVIPNGINIEDFNIPYSKEECREKLGLPQDKNIILFLGVLHLKKGPHVLIKAMPKIINEVPNAELLVAGDGMMKEQLKTLVSILGINRNVRFVGFIEERLKPFYYKAADVFCLPSIITTEVFPLVLLEASASGLPMVVSDMDTFKCIVEDGYNGLFARRGDAKSLADAIIYLLENEDLRKKMGENVRKKIENYSWGKIAEMTERIYEKVSR
jgi:glycosyltransferase involved in cell wall biosynthesis